MYKSSYSYITPEGQARQEIDKNLTKAGWIIHDKIGRNESVVLPQRLKKSILDDFVGKKSIFHYSAIVCFCCILPATCIN